MHKINNNTEQFYKEIINKVINQSKEHFAQYNINEEVLLELKRVRITIIFIVLLTTVSKIWSEKLIMKGIFQNKAGPYNTGHPYTPFKTTNYPQICGKEQNQVIGTSRKYLFLSYISLQFQF